MSAKNNCTFIGNLGRDVEIRTTQQGTTVATLAIPVTSGFGDKARTSWVRATLWGKRAEGGLMQYLVKGQQVSVCGEIALNTYTNNEGVEKTSLEMRIEDIALIGSKQDKASQKPQQRQQPQQKNGGFPSQGGNQAPDPFAQQGAIVEDDIPF